LQDCDRRLDRYVLVSRPRTRPPLVTTLCNATSRDAGNCVGMVIAAHKLVKLPGGGNLTYSALFKRLYDEYDRDEIGDRAAQVAYYLLFAMFPFLFFLTTLSAYLPLGRAVDEISRRLHSFLPGAASLIIESHVQTLVSTGRPKLLTFGLLMSIWSASRGVDAIRTALNRAYAVRERRPYWRLQLMAVGTTVAGAVLVLLGVTLLIAGGSAGYWISTQLGFSSVYVAVASWMRWPITIFVMISLIALVYFLVPDVEQKFKYITPGSVIATGLWLLATWGFGAYASRFGNYNAVYGSIGGVVVLLTFLFISAFVFLMGGVLNAVLEHASREGKEPGQHQEGGTTDVPAPERTTPDPSIQANA